jgi:hypothetical protein
MCVPTAQSADWYRTPFQTQVAARAGELETLRSLVEGTGGGGNSRDGSTFDPHTATDVHGRKPRARARVCVPLSAPVPSAPVDRVWKCV